jgi:tRNA(Ile)-lysidine synthase
MIAHADRAGDLAGEPEATVAAALRDIPGPVLVGFSGGLDSTVLLHAASRVARSASAHRIVALHVNHGLQPGADAWEAHCARVAAELGVAFTARRVAVQRRGSLEAAARRARYAVFSDCLETPGACLLLAHHRDDQAETGLLRLLQGRGLYGMPAERPLGAGRLLRPLLGLSRQALERYARSQGLRWIDDPSNADPVHDRNFVRHQVLPGLRERFPAIDEALLQAIAARRARDAHLLDSTSERLAATSVALPWLFALEPAGQLAWLRLWLGVHGRALPTGRALRSLLDQLGAAGDRQPRLVLDRGELRRYRGRLWLVDPPPAPAPQELLALPARLQFPHGELAVVPAPCGFAVRGPLTVRFRAGGEGIRSGGHLRSVKQLLQAHGVPPWDRSGYPLLFDADGLAAVPGLAERDPTGDGPRYRALWRRATSLGTVSACAVPFR